jgi:hypothetical protein
MTSASFTRAIIRRRSLLALQRSKLPFDHGGLFQRFHVFLHLRLGRVDALFKTPALNKHIRRCPNRDCTHRVCNHTPVTARRIEVDESIDRAGSVTSCSRKPDRLFQAAKRRRQFNEICVSRYSNTRKPAGSSGHRNTGAAHKDNGDRRFSFWAVFYWFCKSSKNMFQLRASACHKPVVMNTVILGIAVKYLTGVDDKRRGLDPRHVP